MSDRKFSMDDYVDVAERIQDFIDVYPEGSLQTIHWSVADVTGKTFIVYRAAAYRSPDDPRPGHGIAWEPFPGATSFTKNSELMNAETAAWGRAILALGLIANRKLASRQEVRNRVAEQEGEGATDSKPSSRRAAPTRGNAQTPSPDGHSGAEDKPQDASEGEQVSEETLATLRVKFKAAGITMRDLKAKSSASGVSGNPDTWTQDHANWMIAWLDTKIKEKSK